MQTLAKTILLLSMLLMASCGFHLRGGHLSTGLTAPISVQSEVGLHFLQSAIEREIVLAGGDISAGNGAERQLLLQREESKQRVVARSDSGRAAEYLLELILVIQIRDPGAEPQVKSFSASRSYLYNNQEVLASDQQQRELTDALRQELARRVVRFLAQNPPPGAATLGD